MTSPRSPRNISRFSDNELISQFHTQPDQVSWCFAIQYLSLSNDCPVRPKDGPAHLLSTHYLIMKLVNGQCGFQSVEHWSATSFEGYTMESRQSFPLHTGNHLFLRPLFLRNRVVVSIVASSETWNILRIAVITQSLVVTVGQQSQGWLGSVISSLQSLRNNSFFFFEIWTRFSCDSVQIWSRNVQKCRGFSFQRTRPTRNKFIATAMCIYSLL